VINVLYIYALNEDDLVYSTKYQKPLNNLPKIGQELINFYDEKIIFFNFETAYLGDSSEELYLKDNKLTNKDNVRLEILLNNAEIFLNTLYNFKNEYIMESFRDDPSVIKAMEYNFKDLFSLYDVDFKIKYSNSKLTKEENISLLKSSYNNIITLLNDKSKPYSLIKERGMLNGAMTYIMSEVSEVELKNLSCSKLLSFKDEDGNAESLDSSSGYKRIMDACLTYTKRDLYKELQNDKIIIEKNKKGLKNEK
jgi:hypothetical protein